MKYNKKQDSSLSQDKKSQEIKAIDDEQRNYKPSTVFGLNIDFSDLKNTWDKIEQDYTEKYLKPKTNKTELNQKQITKTLTDMEIEDLTHIINTLEIYSVKLNTSSKNLIEYICTNTVDKSLILRENNSKKTYYNVICKLDKTKTIKITEKDLGDGDVKLYLPYSKYNLYLEKFGEVFYLSFDKNKDFILMKSVSTNKILTTCIIVK